MDIIFKINKELSDIKINVSAPSVTEEVTNILNKESGLKGISGKNDLRDVDALAEQGNSNAKLAQLLLEKSIIIFC